MKQWKPPSGWERAVYVLMLLQVMLGVVYGTLFGFRNSIVCWMAGLGSRFLFFILGPYELRKKGGAPKGASIVLTRVLVDTGVYAVVRHPKL
jgi:protein-S-isoprenylcysteine O-methyltransferase Ste14